MPFSTELAWEWKGDGASERARGGRQVTGERKRARERENARYANGLSMCTKLDRWVNYHRYKTKVITKSIKVGLSEVLTGR